MNVWPEGGVRLRYFAPIVREWIELEGVSLRARELCQKEYHSCPYNPVSFVCMCWPYEAESVVDSDLQN